MPESNVQQAGCPCDSIEFPRQPDIAAGLPALPRQLAGFPEWRLAMLGRIRTHRRLDEPGGNPPLADWRAREGDDLGIMLLEMWAYVLDVLGFYDERIANEAYLRTAQLPGSLRRLVELIGYHPRPALAARVTLALLAEEGNGPVALPPGVAFRSGPFGDESPQVFETGEPAAVDPRRNEWTLAPIRDDALDSGRFFLDPGEAAVGRGDLVLIRWGAAVSQMASARVTGVSQIQALDGETYLQIELDPKPDFGSGATPGSTLLFKPTLSSRVLDPSGLTVADIMLSADLLQAVLGSVGTQAPTSGGILQALGLPGTGTAPSAAVVQAVAITGTESRLQLDSVQPALEPGQSLIVSRGSSLHAAQVTNVTESRIPQNEDLFKDLDLSPPTIPATSVRITPPIDRSWNDEPRRLQVHFGLVEAGRLTRPAKHRIGLGELAPQAPFDGVSEPLEPAAQPEEVLLLGNDGHGARLCGTVNVDQAGAGLLEPAQDAGELTNPLRTPVRVFGNLVEATRGESVVNEVLGSGNAASAFQKFAPAKHPLTYRNDPTAPGGRRSTLQIRVNGLLWREVPSFFGVGPEEEVYTVRQNPETGRSIVTFGDGQTGARLPSGAQIVASYRFGAGAAAPPANSITQLARPVPGIRAAVNPIPAGGGADGDRPKDLRRNAPDSALLLGRAVSLLDFEVLAREFGVINAQAGWTWDFTTQRAVVKIWFIPNNQSIAADNERAIKATLLGQADPNTPLVARQATAMPAKLVVDLIVDPRFVSDEVELAVVDALTDPGRGLLALENIPIGHPLFRSALFEQILAVEGAESVRALTFNGQPFGATRTADEGRYYNFLPQLRVGQTAAGDTLFAKSAAGNTSNMAAF